MIRYWIAILVLCPAPALAQPVFFDDFDGNALLPHWGLPRPEDWAYNVSNSMLNVTGLFYPSDPDFPSNGAIMGASYAPQHDFRMDVWMGWEAGARPHALNITVTGAPGGGLADFGFRDEPASGPIPVILAAAGGAVVTMPAPPPGLYQFTITRAARQFEFSFDGQFFASLPVNFDITAGGVALAFEGPYPGQLGPLHVDRIQVIPAPGAAIFLVPLAFVCAGLRRRVSR